MDGVNGLRFRFDFTLLVTRRKAPIIWSDMSSLWDVLRIVCAQTGMIWSGFGLSPE